MSALALDVIGTPAPQGSHRGFVVNGRAVITQDNKKTKPWRQDVKATALSELATLTPWTPYDGPVEVQITFRMPRPRYHYGTGRNANQLKATAPAFVDKKPDIDKLTRSTLDALTEAGVWRDDSQVASMVLTKEYATNQQPGAHILVFPLNSVPAQPPTSRGPSSSAGTDSHATVQEALL